MKHWNLFLLMFLQTYLIEKMPVMIIVIIYILYLFSLWVFSVVKFGQLINEDIRLAHYHSISLK